MDFKNIDTQKNFLNRNLDKINTVVGAYIGTRVNLQIVERKSPWGAYLKLEDNHNFAHLCGIMSRAWKEVRIDTFNIWFNDEGCELVMHFSYEHIDGGHNGAEFCRLEVFDDFITIK